MAMSEVAQVYFEKLKFNSNIAPVSEQDLSTLCEVCGMPEMLRNLRGEKEYAKTS